MLTLGAPVAEKLTSLAQQVQERFDEVLEAGYKKALPKGMDKTSADVEHV